MERQVLIKMKNPFIIHAHSFFQDSINLYMVMELCPGGDLSSKISREGVLSEDLIKIYAAEIAVALGHLHKNDILFRDLKPANVLLDK